MLGDAILGIPTVLDVIPVWSKLYVLSKDCGIAAFIASVNVNPSEELGC